MGEYFVNGSLGKSVTSRVLATKSKVSGRILCKQSVYEMLGASQYIIDTGRDG